MTDLQESTVCKKCAICIFLTSSVCMNVFFTRQQVSLMLESLSYFSWFQCGSFLKWGYPQIIHFARIFYSKPTIWGYHHFRKPPWLQDWPGAELRLPLPQGSGQPARFGRRASGCHQRCRRPTCLTTGNMGISPWKQAREHGELQDFGHESRNWSETPF